MEIYKPKEKSLTEEEINQLIDDLAFMEAVCLGYREFCKKIHKDQEAINYVRKFVKQFEVKEEK
jgi:tRNA nucleotidyltransferase/poly(A) polymerase